MSRMANPRSSRRASDGARLRGRDVGATRYTMNRIFSRLLVIAATLAVFAAAGHGFLAWNFNRPPFDLARLDGLSPGISQAQVRDLLGNPRAVSENSWVYARWLAWPMVHVYFDESGAYARHHDDY